MRSNPSNTKEYNDVTAIVLAGGKSTRMGQDKGLMPFQDGSFAEKVISTVNTITSNVLVSVNTSNIEAYQKLGVTTILDKVLEKGPIGGIVSVIPSILTSWFFVASVDSPLFTIELFQALWNEKNGKQAVIFTNQKQSYPLLALYHKSTISQWEDALKHNRLKVTDLVKSFDCKMIELSDNQANSVININTLSEYNALLIKEI